MSTNLTYDTETGKWEYRSYPSMYIECKSTPCFRSYMGANSLTCLDPEDEE